MILAIVNQKGGTGKTTTTLNLGSALSHYGKNVLLVDLDPQASLSYCLGLDESPQGIENLIYNEKRLDETVVEQEGMDIIPASLSLADVEINMLSANDREYILKTMLKKTTGYDFVLIDCPPSLSMLTINALVAADMVLVPVLPEILSVKGLDLILNTVDRVKQGLNRKLEIAGILPVMVDKRKKLNKMVIDKIKKEYGLKVFQSIIHTSVQLAEAPLKKKSIIAQKPNSKSASDYLSLAKELMVLNYH